MKKIKLYQVLSEKQLKAFLEQNGIIGNEIPITDQKNEDPILSGDICEVAGHKFKKIYSQYQCLETPTEKHQKQTLNAKKAPNDHYRK